MVKNPPESDSSATSAPTYINTQTSSPDTDPDLANTDIRIVRRRRSRGIEQLNAIFTTILILGILCFFFPTLNFVLCDERCSLGYGTGIWGGILIMMNGAVGVATCIIRSNTAVLIMYAVSAIGAMTGCLIIVEGVVNIYSTSCSKYSDFDPTSLSLNILMVFAAVLYGILLGLCAAYTCSLVRTKNRGMPCLVYITGPLDEHYGSPQHPGEMIIVPAGELCSQISTAPNAYKDLPPAYERIVGPEEYNLKMARAERCLW